MIGLACWMASCGKQMPSADTPISFDINVLETKAENAVWEKGDKILVFFDGIGSKYVSLEFDGGKD